MRRPNSQKRLAIDQRPPLCERLIRVNLWASSVAGWILFDDSGRSASDRHMSPRKYPTFATFPMQTTPWRSTQNRLPSIVFISKQVNIGTSMLVVLHTLPGDRFSHPPNSQLIAEMSLPSTDLHIMCPFNSI